MLKDPVGVRVDEVCERIGFVEDHHVAEYRALIEGLRLARTYGIDRLRVFLDSVRSSTESGT